MPGVLSIAVAFGCMAVAGWVLAALRSAAATDRHLRRVRALEAPCFDCSHPLVVHMPADRPPPDDDFCPAPVACGVCGCGAFLGVVGSW